MVGIIKYTPSQVVLNRTFKFWRGWSLPVGVFSLLTFRQEIMGFAK